MGGEKNGKNVYIVFDINMKVSVYSIYLFSFLTLATCAPMLNLKALKRKFPLIFNSENENTPPPITPMRKGHTKTLSEQQFEDASKSNQFKVFCAKCRAIVDKSHTC